MAYEQDKLSIPTPRATGLTDNVFDGTGNPDLGECADISVSLAGNTFPRDKVKDSLSDEEAVLS